MALVTLGQPGCHVERQSSASGPGSGVSPVIKFENLTRHALLIRIPDAFQEFELDRDVERTVEVYSEEGIDVFYVEILRSGYADMSVAPRWTGFVGIGKRVTVQHISRVTIRGAFLPNTWAVVITTSDPAQCRAMPSRCFCSCSSVSCFA